MKLDLWLWDMLLQGREFRNKTNENWQKISDWSGEIETGLRTIYHYVDQQDAKLAADLADTRDELNGRVDNLIAGVEQPSETVDARADRHGKIYPTLRTRLNAEQEAAEKHSTIHTDLSEIMTMASQDLGVWTYKEIIDRQTVCLLNVSSSDKTAPIQLTQLSEVAYTGEITSLVLAKLGPNERYRYEETGRTAS
ncbi:alpha-amylase [Listeria costaricensis]|uniref:alpha-amylase n=1 Tax=Listeria costaricensis TaxID=2026604 RepID=UPI000C081CEA|nr:alpha-amylase [Listeria costaricensis]